MFLIHILIQIFEVENNIMIIKSITTDVRRGTSGTSRDVPIFVQFHRKFVQLMTHKEKKKVAKNKADLVKTSLVN